MKYGLMIIGGLFAIFNMTGCGGSGADNSTTNKASLNGVAAVGAPLANAVVTIKDANDKTSSTTTSSTGNYSFGDLTGFVAPLLIQATGTAGGTEYVLHSVLDAVPAQGVTGTLNTNPASDAITTQAFASPPAQVFADAAKIKALRTDQLTKTKAAVTAALADTMKALSIDAKTDLMTTSFTANSTGVDKILDLVDFSNQRASTASKDQDIKISLKSTGQAVTVTPTSTAATVAKLAAPSAAEASLDLSGIKTLVSKTSDLMKTQNLINSDTFANSFSDAYLDQGQTKSEILSQIRNGLVGATLSDYVIKRCDGATKICFGTLTLTKTDGYTSGKVMPVIYANGQWQFYGDRAPFSMEANPGYQAHYTVSGGSSTLIYEQIGMNIYIQGSRTYATRSNGEYKSAKLKVSYDAGSTYPDEATFEQLSGCDQGLIVTSNKNNNQCENFVQFSTEMTNKTNAALEKGQLKLVVELYPNADFSGNKLVSDLVIPTLFTSDTGKAALADSGLSVNDADLGSSERLRFTGSSFDFLTVTMKSRANMTQTKWQHSFNDNLTVKALRNDLTLAKFKNICTECAKVMTDDAIFYHIDLQIRDRQQRPLTIHKTLQTTQAP
jgi:hypothetical protein